MSSRQWVAGHRSTTLILLALGITAVGASIRMTGLENNPPGLWQDEASTGVDAYLLWTTGKDRAGVSFPIIARSFGDYPLAGYRYLTAPIVGIFGLTPGNERFMASLLGTLLILVSSLFLLLTHGRRAALGCALSCAFGAMGIMFSRFGSEAMMMPFTLILGVTLIEVGRDVRRRPFIWLGALSLAACAYSYHAVKIYLPVWMIGYLVYIWPLVKQLWPKERRHVIGPMILFAALVMPSVVVAFSDQGMARGRSVMAWTRHENWALVRTILNNYLAYFDPGMMFMRGGKYVAQSIPKVGLWNLIDLPLFAIALYSMARSKSRRRLYFFVFYWFLVGPIPGGLTYETHNIGRAIGWLPAAHLISGIGFSFLCGAALEAKRRGAQIALALILLGWIPTGIYVGYLTLVEYPTIARQHYQFHISDALKCARAKRDGKDRIVVSPRVHGADFFARFWLSELPMMADGERPWLYADRTLVAENEVYVFPPSGKLPKGTELCRVGDNPPLMLVFGPPIPSLEDVKIPGKVP